MSETPDTSLQTARLRVSILLHMAAIFDGIRNDLAECALLIEPENPPAQDVLKAQRLINEIQAKLTLATAPNDTPPN